MKKRSCENLLLYDPREQCIRTPIKRLIYESIFHKPAERKMSIFQQLGCSPSDDEETGPRSTKFCELRYSQNRFGMFDSVLFKKFCKIYCDAF